jgi:hypothetical protein
MPVEEHDDLARELSEFGYRETDDPDEADRRRYYKVERWDSTERHVLQTEAETLKRTAQS